MPNLAIRGHIADPLEPCVVVKKRSRVGYFTRLGARWLTLLTGLLSWSTVAGAVTIAIDEFQHDTVQLPFVPQQGTLFLCEGPSAILSPVTCEAPVSDTIVFLAGLTTGTVLLESDLPEVGESGAPGDRALPIPFPAPFFSVSEPGAEGMNQTLLYTPVPGQPGFASVDGKPVSYAITSDEVPEPGACVLVMATLMGLLGYKRLQKYVHRPDVFDGARARERALVGRASKNNYVSRSGLALLLGFIVLLLTAPNTKAARIVFDGLNASLDTGSLAGTRFPVSFSYDADQVNPVGDSFVQLNSFDFTLLGVPFTRSDIFQGGQVIFRDGRLDNVTASFQVILPPHSPVENITFGFGGPGVIGYSDLDAQAGIGSFTFVSAAVPEPAPVCVLALSFLILIAFRAKTKKQERVFRSMC